ncbi:hypothetical protein [Phormidium sp. CCY1219]|uniref:hypothetical protein n=1 Tax=Phormidium sp. CCY1219 TaxID=2886104 RepID=UPI002D1E4C62|nr:hypothetical protein [Phormidium sp. CCY1219]MEB3831216.1 hypothetical protein [Phormidium sp. CCY1219]
MTRDEQVFKYLASSEAIEQHLLAWLLQKPIASDRPPTGELASPETPPGENENFVAQDETDDLHPLDSQAIDPPPGTAGDSEAGFANLNESSFGGDPPTKPGEIPAVQDRFYALVKRRLQAEILSSPPLFPWETEILDYEPENIDFSLAQEVPAMVWSAQLPALSLPISLPEKVLAQILARSQTLVQSSVREGAKLVRAVEELFPDRFTTLNHLAGLVMQMSPTRGSNSSTTNPVSKTAGEFPATYEAATSDQQMVLCLLAAREIMGTLSMTVRACGHPVERQWLTSAGMLSIQVQYLHRDPEASSSTESGASLKVQAQLPCAGSLHLHHGETQTTAQRPHSGVLSVELNDAQPNQTYLLEVRFHNHDNNSLTFVVFPTTDTQR